MLTTAPHLQVRRPSPTTAEFTVTTCPAPTLSNRLLFSIVFLLRISLALSVLLLLHSTWPLSSPFHDPDASSTTAAAVASTAATPTVVAVAYTQGHNGSRAVGHLEEGALAPTGVEKLAAEGVPTGGGTQVPTVSNTTQQHQRQPPAPTTTLVPPPRPTTLLTPTWLPYLLHHLHASPPGVRLASLATTIPPSLFVPLCLALLYATTLRIHTTESLLVLRGLGIQTSSSGGSFLASWRAGTRFIPTEKIRDVLINEAFRGFGVRYYLVVVVDGEDDVVVVFPRLLPGRRVVEGVWRGVRGCLWEPQEKGLGG